MRPRFRVLTIALLCLLAGASVWAAAGAGSSDGPSKAYGSADPRFELRGDWRFGNGKYRFTRSGSRMEGRSRAVLKVGKCRVARNARVFRGFRFAGRSDGHDVWKGKLAVVRRDCSRRLVRSTITVLDDLRFVERSRLAGEPRDGRSVFRRIRPEVRESDDLVGTWLRNGVGIVVSAGRDRYEGRAREDFLISNGCTVPAGTVIWTMRPTAPGRYQGTIPTFVNQPEGCRAGHRNRSKWRIESRDRLIRQAPRDKLYAYQRG